MATFFGDGQINTQTPLAPTSSAPLLNFSTATKPVSTISTQSGVDTLTKVQTQESKLAGVPPTPAVTGTATDTTKTPPADANKVTLINPDTGQTITFNDASINKDNIQSYMGSGYHLSEASGNLPNWLGPTTTGSTGSTGNKELDESKTTLAAAKSDLGAAVGKLTSFDVSNDPQLKTLLGGITSQWDQRIADYQKAEDSRIAALNTTGIRIGSRYTGGMTGSIISAEEKASVDKIASLQSQKQQALAAARSAFENGKWKQYNDLVQIAQKAYDNQLSEVKTLQTTQAKQDTKLKDSQQGALRDANISKLISSGISEPDKILSELQKAGDTTTTLKDVAAAIKAITPTTSKDVTALKFTTAQLSKLYSAGLTKEQVQGLSDYYNGESGASHEALSSLTPQQQKIVHDAMNGISTKSPGDKPVKSYSDGSMTYTADTLSTINGWLANTKGEDDYVDPNAYLQAAKSWTQDGGSIKGFLKNFPVSSWVNPANESVVPAINEMVRQDASVTKTTTTSTDLSSQISSLFSGSTPQK